MAAKLIETADSAYHYPLLIKHLLYRPLAVAPKQEIVYRDLSRYDYLTLRERIGQLANGLARLGVEPGDTVAVMDWDSHRYLECFFAIPMMGAILQTVNVRLNPDQILYTLNHTRPKLLLLNAEFLPLIEGLKDRLETIEQFVLISDEDAPSSATISFVEEYEQLLRQNPADYDFPDLDENTQATVFYTTGTTGLPKGVYNSHRQIVVHALGMLSAFAMPCSQGRLHSGDVYMPITPMFHVYAWSFPYVATLMGIKQVYPGRYAPDTLLGLKQKEGVTFSHCVATILHMLLTHPIAQDMDLRGWKMVMGGGALPKGLAQLALDRGMDIFAAYGMSETGPLLAVSHLKPSLQDGDSARELEFRTKTGLPAPLVDLRIVDGDMNDVPHDGKSTGEIVARAPWLTQGYLHNPEASEALWAGGYLHTNDIANIDDEGYLQITDRLKDVIKSGGEWVSSLEVEDSISQYPSVSEVAVIGIKNAKWGERPMALIVLKPDQAGKVSPGDIRSHLMEFVDKGLLNKISVPDPDHIQFVESLPKTSVGKLDKKLMREQFTG
ncbi:MAG: fatty acid--CoA ligase [Gammaproteobacteria bacterium]|nr:fatty acid--CoA ligase [Gammaproteobacteria bacterium]MCP5458273.1 fatty acid--CoA ligase [Gammaproteobacteria bacterium]